MSFKVPWWCLGTEGDCGTGGVGLLKAAQGAATPPVHSSLFGVWAEDGEWWHWKGAFILAEGQHFLYTFSGNNIQDGICVKTLCNLIHPGQEGFMTYHVYFNQVQFPQKCYCRGGEQSAQPVLLSLKAMTSP